MLILRRSVKRYTVYCVPWYLVLYCTRYYCIRSRVIKAEAHIHAEAISLLPAPRGLAARHDRVLRVRAGQGLCRSVSAPWGRGAVLERSVRRGHGKTRADSYRESHPRDSRQTTRSTSQHLDLGAHTQQPESHRSARLRYSQPVQLRCNVLERYCLQQREPE